MRCITIRQPWATLIAIGEKRLETRGWKTNYRGELAIHAGKRVDLAACLTEPVRSLLAASGYTAANLPTGAVVAIARLAGCHPVVANDGETAVLNVREGGSGGCGEVGERGKAGRGGDGGDGRNGGSGRNGGGGRNGVGSGDGKDSGNGGYSEDGRDCRDRENRENRENRALVVTGQEYRFGDFALGRYGWELVEVRKLPEPVPAAGKQGLWNWEARW
ncbi:ASCH domain-containing protein [Paenibacillus sp. alder61]|uniref:ASCH domain-containing protein n=1 Tax=Paenibacillus sp. alder61 TaxID=2862948 RepID=UPI00296FCC20|nr:ASCH domain-containing protein [Paenibacillus sp. alder61]